MAPNHRRLPASCSVDPSGVRCQAATADELAEPTLVALIKRKVRKNAIGSAVA